MINKLSFFCKYTLKLDNHQTKKAQKLSTFKKVEVEIIIRKFAT